MDVERKGTSLAFFGEYRRYLFLPHLHLPTLSHLIFLLHIHMPNQAYPAPSTEQFESLIASAIAGPSSFPLALSLAA
jgi:hypothetical protein